MSRRVLVLVAVERSNLLKSFLATCSPSVCMYLFPYLVPFPSVPRLCPTHTRPCLTYVSSLCCHRISDITFLVGEGKEKMYAHKVVLAARCEVFRAMFAEQKSQVKKGTDKKNGSSSSDAPLVLQDVRPSGT